MFQHLEFFWFGHFAGDKSEAKALMTKAGVPVVPGYHGSDQSTDRYSLSFGQQTSWTQFAVTNEELNILVSRT